MGSSQAPSHSFAHSEMAHKVCVVIGAGEKLGYSVVRKFASEGYKVVASRRRQIPEADLKNLGENVHSIPCDVSRNEDVKALFNQTEQEHGPVHTVIYNAGVGVFKTWDQLSVEDFESTFNINAKGLFMVAQAVCPGMVERGEGVIGITGATASLRGKPFTAGFAPAKGAQRMLAQSLARDLGPKGVHVFLAIIDGVIGSEAEDKYLHPDRIAEAYWNLANQQRSVWTFQADLRPYTENW